MLQGPEKVHLGNIFCHGENLFIHIETTAPPPRRKALRKRIMRRKSNNSFGVYSPRQSGHDLSSNSHVSFDDNSCSSETSEMDTHSAIPTWLREELAQSVMIVNDGNEADDTSCESDEQRRVGGIDSSMSSIQINRALTPVVSDPLCHTNFVRGDKCSPRSQTIIRESLLRTPLNITSCDQVGFQNEAPSDSSSGDVSQGKLMKHKSDLDTSKINHPYNSKVKSSKGFGKQRISSRGKGKPLFLSKETNVGRGFISDATIKRREESLLFQLERVKKEKKHSDARIRLLEKERENQQALLKEEVEKEAHQREQSLVSEVERLRLEIESQNSLLNDKQQVVRDLQHQLSLLSEQRHIENETPVTPRSSSQGDDSASSELCSPRADNLSSFVNKKAITKICNLQ